ncbi:hypothetical protein L0244_04485, partial [bacterium]|nr:hypothetical protein [bacterium]
AGIHATQAPPPQFAILRDGYSTGTVYKVRSEADCAILDQTPASVAYRLQNHPRVLLLSESGGTNVWLARRFSAESITVVQPDPEILNILRGPLAAPSGFVFSGKDIRVVHDEPRLFLEKPGNEKYDVIQIVSAEEMAAESRGAGGLQEDYLLTVEALRAAWKKLSSQGIISISRGSQTPPRDSLKLVMMMRTHLQNERITDFSRQIVLLQNYLADNILLFRSPDSSKIRKLPEIAKALAMEILYPPELSSASNQINDDQFPNLNEALGEVLSDRYREFVKTWIYDIRPSTDDRPFFRDFFRVHSIPWMKEVYSDQWYQNVELGFAILILIAIQALILSFLFLIVPVLIHLRRQIFDSSISNSGFTIFTTLLYFFAIGIGFMGFEIVAISRSALFLGDPLYAATTAISCLLLGAGIGSLFAGRRIERAAQSIR